MNEHQNKKRKKHQSFLLCFSLENTHKSLCPRPPPPAAALSLSLYIYINGRAHIGLSADATRESKRFLLLFWILLLLCY